MQRTNVTCGLALATLLIGGCATHKPEGGYSGAESDPWEATNRSIYAFNNVVDKATLRPLARGYRAVTPRFARVGISNFFSNLAYPGVALNALLQGKVKQSGRDLLRFGMNTTLGLGGLVDIASDAGLTANEEDFGQTLAVWGVPAGPYVQLPFLGPSTLRDAPAQFVDVFTDGQTYVDESSVRDKLRILSLVDTRYRLLSAEALLDDAYDPYLTLREAWLQRREYVIYDGEPPEDDDFFDEAFLEEDEEFLEE